MAATLILLLIAGCAERGSQTPETNVILITLDTVRADHLSCYGYPRATTPNLDSFARSSTWYTNAQTTAPWTLPAHASLFTGLYPSEHGAQMVLPGPELRSEEQFRQALSLDGDFATLAEVMDGLGYDTAGVASNFLYLDTAYNLQGRKQRESRPPRPKPPATAAAVREGRSRRGMGRRAKKRHRMFGRETGDLGGSRPHRFRLSRNTGKPPE